MPRKVQPHLPAPGLLRLRPLLGSHAAPAVLQGDNPHLPINLDEKRNLLMFFQAKHDDAATVQHLPLDRYTFLAFVAYVFYIPL